MRVSQNRSGSVRLRFAAAVLAFGPVFGSITGWAKGPEPPRRIRLAELGYLPPPANVLAGGGALSTVHFLDEQHLLVTFGVRRLMKRLPDCPPEDMDRTVEAVLVELPSAKVLARTNWRIHDSSQYLWPLGNGRLLLRVRDTLTTIAPLEHLGHGEAFAEQPFLQSKRRIAAVLLSAERDLATVETVEPPARNSNGEALPEMEEKLTQINFYRVLPPQEPDGRVVAQAAGMVAAKGLVRIPLNASGYLEILEERPSRWLFDFTSYGGKHVELSPFDTTCRPAATFVNQAEFVALGCRGSNDRLSIGGFNMKGEQMWQQDFTDTHAFPNYVFAPDAGRFALSRNIVAATDGITPEFAPDAFTTQEIRVYQSYSGKQLLRVEASPVQRVGQNYDLSPQGLSFAVVHNDAVEIYRLPELSKADVAGVQAAKALAPAAESLAVNLAARQGSVTRVAPAVETVVPVETKPVMAAGGTLGDGTPVDAPRKAPTLYTLPEDKGRPQE